MAQRLRDPNNVAAIIHALRQVHGDDIARIMLTEGTTLASIIDVILRSTIENRLAAKLITASLQSGDFVVTPDITGPSHIRYLYDPPNTLQVVDMLVILPERTLASTDIRLRLRELR